MASARTMLPEVVGRSPKTINNVLTTLFNILKNARGRKLIASVPLIEWLYVGEQEFDVFDFTEAERLLEGAAKVEEWSCAILLAVKTGMRMGELRAFLNLEGEDYSLGEWRHGLYRA